MPINGSSKGSSFERKICKQLSLWISEGKRDDLFWRTAGSGARATVRSKQGKATSNADGDICAVDEAGKWLTERITFELKRGYNTADISDLLDATCKKPLWKMLNQAAAAAARTDTIPMLIWKPDRKPEVCIFPINPESERFYSSFDEIRGTKMWVVNSTVNITEYVVILFEDLLRQNPNCLFVKEY